MKYLKKFATAADYESAESSLILPNVSLVTEGNTVHYNPYVDPYAGHDYVDLGLPNGTLWATMNIGADSITDYGLYFQWGDTQGYTADQVGSGSGQKAFTWADYKFNPSGDGSTFTKYNSTDGKTVLDASDDAVAAAWGGSWRMPTETEFLELLNYTNKQWTTVDGVSGYKLANKNDNSKYVFFPATGLCKDGSVSGVGLGGNYWSLKVSNVTKGIRLCVSNSYCNTDGFLDRSVGFSIRGVVGQ